MAGHQIALLRVLRLKPVCQAAVTSPEFKDLGIFQEIARVLLCDAFWVYLFLMCRPLYPPMRVLRLADQKIAAMDKLHFYVCQTNTLTPRYLAEAEQHSAQLLTDAIVAVLADTTDLASIGVDDDEDDDASNESGADESMEDDESDDEDMVRLSLFYLLIYYLSRLVQFFSNITLSDDNFHRRSPPIGRGIA